MKKIGLFIGRFQPFHNGHKMIVEKMIEENEKNIIVLGSIDKNDEKNIFDYETRKKFIIESLPEEKNIVFYGISDIPSDKIWIEQILNIPEIQDAERVKIYCGDRIHDYAIEVIEREKQIFGEKEIEIVEIRRDYLPISGTEIRKDIKDGNIQEIAKKTPKNVFQNISKDNSSWTQ